MSKAVCKTIQYADANLKFDPQSQNYTLTKGAFDEYCPPVKGGETDKCNNDGQKVSSAFIGLINMLIGNNDEDNIESDKLAEYAILWLRYKLNQKEENGSIKLNDFYTKHIETNTHYNEKITSCKGNTTNKEFIDKKKYLMNMDIKDISNFYKAFEILCKMYSTCSENNKNCPNCSENANEFAQKYKELNEGSNNNRSNSYKNILYNLSTDYNNLKEYISEKCSDSIEISSFPEIGIPEGPFEIIEATSSSSIASKLIPVLLIFSAIPVFLGIAYKYSLFGFDKRLHRQYLREKIKKIKRKMNHYM
ncbi:CIR protein PIR protein [Plasmodium vinckei petteri]|uniref:CIR protein PIR protein n=1 Tax=Plasmodium vinckei petteri TaxID=138298 RepID=A0A6V7T6Q5_PLAVN|nr:CIR protein PIR protein [Plasmodium vinckei petteri]